MLASFLAGVVGGVTGIALAALGITFSKDTDDSIQRAAGVALQIASLSGTLLALLCSAVRQAARATFARACSWHTTCEGVPLHRPRRVEEVWEQGASPACDAAHLGSPTAASTVAEDTLGIIGTTIGTTPIENSDQALAEAYAPASSTAPHEQGPMDRASGSADATSTEPATTTEGEAASSAAVGNAANSDSVPASAADAAAVSS
jgi:hypothetical protein